MGEESFGHAPADWVRQIQDHWMAMKKAEAAKRPTFLEKVDLVLTLSLGGVRNACGERPLSCGKCLLRACRGMTLLELMVTAMGIATLVAIALPIIEGAQEDLRLHEAVTEIQVIQLHIINYELKYGTIPAKTADLNLPVAVATDPWENPYVYLNFASPDPPGSNPREDQFLKPINTAFDVYSMGPNEETFKNLSNPKSRDDIIRAADGSFVGVADEF
jgi:general secretion pathway protein G